MKFDLIRDIVEQKPFVPVVITTTTGDAYNIPHREHVFLPPSESELLVYDEDMHFRIFDLKHIVSIEPLKPAKRKK